MEPEIYFDCGSIINGKIHSIWEAAIYGFNNVWNDASITINSCDSIANPYLVLRSEDLETKVYSSSGCGSNGRGRKAILVSEPLPTGVYYLNVLAQDEKTGNFSLNISCHYPTQAPTS